MFKAMFIASDEFCEEDCIDFSWKESWKNIVKKIREKYFIYISKKLIIV